MNPGQLRQQQRLITSLERVTDTYWEQKDFPAARDRATRRLAISEQVSVADPANLARRADVAAACGRLAMIAASMKDRDAGRDAARKGRAIYEDLARRDPGNYAQRFVIVTLRIDEARLLDGTGESGSVAAYGEAIKSCEALIRDDPKDPEWQRHLFVPHLNVSILHLTAARRDEARRHIDSAARVNAGLRTGYPATAQYQRDAALIEKTREGIEAAGK